VAELQVEQRIRYPPFEPHRFIPAELPIVTSVQAVETGNHDDLVHSLQSLTPSFKLGGEASWLVEQRYLIDGIPITDEEVEREQHVLEQNKKPLIVNKQRQGWYLTPNPIHAAVRNFISKTVIFLLITLGYLFIEPLLRSFGVPGIGTGTVRIGLLDYPLLAIIVVPFLFVPLALRVGANLADLVQQQNFLKSEPVDPIVTLVEQPIAGEPLKIKVTIDEERDDWNDIDILWRVGALPPAREEIFRSLGVAETKQPPAGLTTELPHHWEMGLDDGTGGGEEAPMETRDIKGGLFLRPMRSMETAGKLALSDKVMTLEPPELNWPGTVSSGLIRIHWEVIIRIQRSKGGPLLWVLPLAVHHPKTTSTISILPTNDGRAESVPV
jgi:hypothetical protein